MLKSLCSFYRILLTNCSVLLVFINTSIGQVNYEHFTVYNSDLDTSSYLENFNYVSCADLNTDGYLDVIAASVGPSGFRSALWWFENKGTGLEFEKPVIILMEKGENALSYIDVGDVDKDGDPDIVFTSTEKNSRIIWFENVQSADTFLLHELVDMFNEDSAILRDVDKDGDLDLLCSGTRHTEWYSNNGNGDFQFRRRFYEYFDGSRHFISSEDFDGDMINDVLYWRGNNGTWGTDDLIIHFGVGTNGNFGSAFTLSSDYPKEIRDVDLLDVDRDGRKDIIFSSGTESNNNGGSISWSKVNEDHTLNPLVLIAPGVKGITFLELVDLDNDGDLDLLTSAANNPVNYVRPDTDGEYVIVLNEGPEQFSEPIRIVLERGCLRKVTTADLNNDGNMELIGAAYKGVYGLSLDFTTSTLELDENDFVLNIYPNPVADILNIELDGMPASHLMIANQAGESVMNMDLKQGLKHQIEVGHLSPGVYVVTVTSSAAKQSYKIVKM